MGIPVSDILKRLDDLMSDDERIRWSQDERIRWINDAGRELVLRRPAARALTQNLTLVAGTLQRTPEGTAQLLDVVRNIKANGSAGSVIRITDRQIMDDANPDWHSMRASTTHHYMQDDRTPTTFYVYPPAVEGAVVEVLLAVPPPPVSAVTDEIDMRAEFIGPIIDWCLYRMHSKDSEYSQGAVAMQHYSAFVDAIGSPAAAAIQNSAKANSL